MRLGYADRIQSGAQLSRSSETLFCMVTFTLLPCAKVVTIMDSCIQTT